MTFFLWRCDPTRLLPYSLSRVLDHTQRREPQSVGLLWTSDQFVVKNPSTRQHTTLTTDRHLCHVMDSNPQSQPPSGLRPTAWNSMPLGPAISYEFMQVYTHQYIETNKPTNVRKNRIPFLLRMWNISRCDYFFVSSVAVRLLFFVQPTHGYPHCQMCCTSLSFEIGSIEMLYLTLAASLPEQIFWIFPHHGKSIYMS